MEEHKTVSLARGRELIQNTSLSHLSDEELIELLHTIKLFCEMCFDRYLERRSQNKIIQLHSGNEHEEDLKQAA